MVLVQPKPSSRNDSGDAQQIHAAAKALECIVSGKVPVPAQNRATPLLPTLLRRYADVESAETATGSCEIEPEGVNEQIITRRSEM
jgi:hypothetical protein